MIRSQTRTSSKRTGWARWLPLVMMAGAVFLPWVTAHAGVNCATQADGSWTDTGTWDCGIVPGATDNVTINHDVDAPAAIAASNLTIAAASRLEAQGDVTVSGTLTIDGSFYPITDTTITFNSSAGSQTVSGTGLTFDNVVIDNDHTGAGLWVIFQNFVELTGTLTVTTGSALELGAGDTIVYADTTNDLINNGKLMITKDVTPLTTTTTVLFPNPLSVGYQGVDITSSNDLGSVSVIIEGNAADCTDSAPVNYASRCYTITPTMNDAATVKFYVLNTELNGLGLDGLAPYHHTSGSGWSQLTNIVTGTVGSNYSWAQGDTTGFSSFLLADEGNGPTAVRLASLTAAPSAFQDQFAALGLATLVLLLFTWSVRRHRPG